MPIGNSNFSQDFLAGASVANMAAQRQERMMELRSQMAMQAVHERQLAAEADLAAQRSQQIQFNMQQEKKDQADTMANAELWKQDLTKGYTSDEADERAVKRMLMINQPLGLKQAQAISDLRRSRADLQQFTPQVTQPLDTTTGKPAVDEMGRPIKAMTTGKGSAIAVDREPTQVALIKHFVSEHNKAIGTGNNDLAEALRGGLAKATTGTGFTLQTNPDGTLTFTQGPVGGPEALTMANRTKTQATMQQALSTIDVSNRLEPLLNEETVGAKAFANSWIKDRILAQRFPELASEERASAEQLAAQLRASAVKELRSDSNITDGERKQILQAVPTINDPADSPARARKLVRSIRKMSAIHVMVQAKSLGVPIPKAAALTLDDEEIVTLAEQGMITKDQVKEAWKIRHSQ